MYTIRKNINSFVAFINNVLRDLEREKENEIEIERERVRERE